MCNFHYAAMSMVTPQILKFVNFAKKKIKILISREIFSSNKKKSFSHQGLFSMPKNTFVFGFANGFGFNVLNIL